MNIRAQLILGVGGVALLPVFLAGFAVYRASAIRLQAQADANLLSYTRRLASETDSFVYHAVESVRTAAHIPSIARHAASDGTVVPADWSMAAILRDAVVQHPVTVSSCALFDRTGRKLIDTATGPRATDASVAPHVHRTMTEGLPVVAPMFPAGRSPGLWICAPVRMPAGEIVGAIGLWYELATLQKIVALPAPGGDAGNLGAIVDDAGRFLAHAEAPELIGRAGPVRQLASESLTWERWSNLAIAERAGPDRVAALHLQHVPWTVLVISPEPVFARAASELGQALLWLGTLVLALTILAITLAANRLSRPVTALAAAAERLAAGDRDQPLPAGGPGEIRTLARTLDAMRRQLAETLRSLEQRVADLRRSEQRLHQFVDAAPIAMVLAHVSDGSHQFNRMLTRLVGYRADEVPDRATWFRLVYPDPVYREQVTAAWDAHIARLVPGQEAPPFEATVTCRDGTRRLIEFRASRVGDYFDIACLDLTEQRRAEQALRASEERVRLLLEHAAEAIVVLDVESGRFISANPAAEQLFGLPAGRLLAVGPLEVSPERQADGRLSRDAAQGYIAATLGGARPVFEWVHRHADGRDLRCEIRLMQLPDAHRALIRGSMIDLSERRRTEHALRALFQSTAGVTGQAYFDTTAAELARATGVKYALLGEVVRGGTHLRVLAASHPAAVPGAEFPVAESPGGIALAQGEVHVARDLRTRFPNVQSLTQVNLESFLGMAVRTPAGEVLGLVAVFDDQPMPESEAARLLLAVSASRVAAEIVRLRASAELERRVAERTALLAAANAELEAFSYSVSHDLRSPLRIIDGFSRALQEELGAAPEGPAREHLGRIRTAAQRMGALIDDLLRLSRASRVEMHPEPVDLAALAAEIVADLRQRHPERAVEFVCTGPLPVVADRALVRILLENLLDNAWKYTRRQPAPRVMFERTTSSASGADGPAHPTGFVVRDNGAGFDLRYAGKLFAPFQRLHTAAEFEGTGIGLATVRRIVARHGGRVWVDAAPDQGASFYFTLGEPLRPL